MTPGALYLVPTPLDFGVSEAVDPLGALLPGETLAVAGRLTHWIAENAKSARAFLKRVDAAVGLAAPLQEQQILELPRQTHKRGDHTQDDRAARDWLAPALQGHGIGLLSEAGMPAIADPGASVVRAAHELGVPVVSSRQTAFWYDAHPALRADAATAFRPTYTTSTVDGETFYAFGPLKDQLNLVTNANLSTGGHRAQLCRHLNTLQTVEAQMRAYTINAPSEYDWSLIDLGLPRVWSTGLDSRFPEVFAAYASCADAKVDLFGLPYEFWSLGLFILLAAAAMNLQATRGRPAVPPAPAGIGNTRPR